MDNTDFQSTLTRVEIEPDCDTLIVAFTGKAAKFNMIRPFDFFQLTGVLHYSRILIREPWHYSYLKGIDKTGLHGLADWLEKEIKKIGAKRVIFMGVSSGGFAALLMGHLLKPDYVHAFSPFTNFSLKDAFSKGDYKKWPLAVLRFFFFIPTSVRQYLDLKPVLMSNNSTTKFHVHACAQSTDRARAEHLKDCPRMKVYLYPCSTHNVTWTMLKSRCMKELLKVENLDRPDEVYHKFFKDFDPDKCCLDGDNHEDESMPAMEKEKSGLS